MHPPALLHRQHRPSIAHIVLMHPPIYNITYVYNMDKPLPINFYHACTLLHQYCQQYPSKALNANKLKIHDVVPNLQKLDDALQKKQRHDASKSSSVTIKILRKLKNHHKIRTLEAHGYVYDILDIVTYIHTHLYDLPNDFWTNKDDVNMREYNPFQSPRADSGVTNAGRNTPVDILEPFIGEQALRSVSVSLARLRELSIDC